MAAAAPILARNMNGDEITLTVVERCSLIVIQIEGEFEGDAIIMGPGAATQLCLELVEVLFKQHRRGEAGPFSASY